MKRVSVLFFQGAVSFRLSRIFYSGFIIIRVLMQVYEKRLTSNNKPLTSSHALKSDQRTSVKSKPHSALEEQDRHGHFYSYLF